MDDAIVRALDGAAAATGVSYMRMPSGAAHDTMFVAEFVPTAMVFVHVGTGSAIPPRKTPTRPTLPWQPRSSSMLSRIFLRSGRLTR